MNNQAKLANWGMQGKERYYYLKYGENSHGNALLGTATVCVIGQDSVEGWHFVRGIAFCNPKDQFSRKLGRHIALGRAVKAIETHLFTEPIPKNKPAWILTEMLGWAYFSTWGITPTEYERRLFNLCTAEQAKNRKIHEQDV